MRRRPRGITLLEASIFVGLLLVLATAFLAVTSIYRSGLVRGAATQLLANVANAKKLAAQSKKHFATVVFRPTDAPYTSYRVFIDNDEAQEFLLPKGVRIVNTNGLIRNHKLLVAPDGTLLDERGDLIKSPSPGLMTVLGNDSDRVYTVRVTPTTGELQME